MISYLGIAAFGGDLTVILMFKFKDAENPNNLIYFNNDFKGKTGVSWIYYVSSFYVMFNIAAVPVLTIVVRNNLMKLISPHLMPKVAYEVTRYNYFLIY